MGPPRGGICGLESLPGVDVRERVQTRSKSAAAVARGPHPSSAVPRRGESLGGAVREAEAETEAET